MVHRDDQADEVQALTFRSEDERREAVEEVEYQLRQSTAALERAERMCDKHADKIETCKEELEEIRRALIVQPVPAYVAPATPEEAVTELPKGKRRVSLKKQVPVV